MKTLQDLVRRYQGGVRLWLVGALLCLYALAPARAEQQKALSPAQVLVVKNLKSPDSVAIADYYVQKRHIPRANVCSISCPTTENCTAKDFQEQMLEPIKQFIATNRLDVDFIVLTKGMPIRIADGQNSGFCPDSILVAMSAYPQKTALENPYFQQNERFSHRRFRIYLVTRLIGYTRADCLKLIDQALKAQWTKGLFLMHPAGASGFGGYKKYSDSIRNAYALLRKKGFTTVLHEALQFKGNYQNLMGYVSWGSNAIGFKKAAYRSLTFWPGALAETAVSSSGRTFENPESPGQSLIADLIHQGVTGCKGYVSEPFLTAIAHPDILFDRYTSGYSLAESFYMASRVMNWKDMVIGDPLCAPFAVK
jgi:uncharacterized protein (TIGR03790 family)